MSYDGLRVREDSLLFFKTLPKMLKYFTGADVTSYKLKWALKDKLLNASPADVGGIGAALRLVLTHKSLRDKFTGLNRDLEEAGFRSIEVTDTGFSLIRDGDTELTTQGPAPVTVDTEPQPEAPAPLPSEPEPGHADSEPVPRELQPKQQAGTSPVPLRRSKRANFGVPRDRLNL